MLAAWSVAILFRGLVWLKVTFWVEGSFFRCALFYFFVVTFPCVEDERVLSRLRKCWPYEGRLLLFQMFCRCFIMIWCVFVCVDLCCIFVFVVV